VRAIGPDGTIPSNPGARLDHAPALPLRPLTVGELVDAAVLLVRAHPVALLLPAALLAGAEQLLLWGLRVLADAPLIDSPPSPVDLFGTYWLVLAAGAATEAMIITQLGPIAGRAAAANLLGTRVSTRQLLGAGLRQTPALLLIVPIVGVLVAVATLFGPLWLAAYPLFGLAGVLLTLERRGPLSALGRAATLAFRGGMRATAVRLLGYLSWLMLRFAFFLGLGWGAELLELDSAVVSWVLPIGLVVINAAAYASLAATDAMTVLELRIRIEGLDLWLARARSRGPIDERVLVNTR
jgi:hypothetical protein